MFNLDKCKTEIMVFHGQRAEKERKQRELNWGWKLGEQCIRVVETYVYLGVTVDSKGSFGGWRKEREKKAKKAAWAAWRMGIEGQ